MEITEKEKEKIKLEFKTSQMLFEMFKQDFDKEAYLDEIWRWAPWIKNMGDCRRYHAHIMFRTLQKEILESKKWEIAYSEIYAYLEDIFHNEYPKIDQDTGELVQEKQNEELQNKDTENLENVFKLDN